jgi:hypothetical protein
LKSFALEVEGKLSHILVCQLAFGLSFFAVVAILELASFGKSPIKPQKELHV